jgi:FkbM family methyltransferase
MARPDLDRSNAFLRWLRRAESRHRAWRYRVRLDPEEIRWMRGFLRPGDVAVDAGAYKGGYTYWMRHTVGLSGQVYSFEPQPELAEFLGRVVDAFSWTNVHVEQVGLSASRGERTLHVPNAGPAQGASLSEAHADRFERSYRVQLESLDDFLAEHQLGRRVALIKCDVEGHELDVFRGAAQTLATDRPYLLFECEARHRPNHRVDDVFAHLEGLGYRGSFFWTGGHRDINDFNVAEHQVQGRRPYANNFLFEPV